MLRTLTTKLLVGLFLYNMTAISQEAMYLGRQEINPGIVPGYDREVQDFLSSQDSWQTFKAQHGTNLRVLWDEITNTPRIISGGYLSPNIESLSQIDSEFGNRIINQLESLSGLSASDFILNKITRREGRVITRFSQLYNGYHVYGSEVQVSITQTGHIPRIRLSVHPDIDLSLDSFIPELEAKNIAKTLFEFEENADIVRSTKQMVFPVRGEFDIDYHLVYVINIEELSSATAITYYIDSHTGDVVCVENISNHASMNGTVTGYIFPEHSTDAKVEEGWTLGTVSAGSYSDETASSGYYDIFEPSSGAYTVTASLEADHLRIVDQSGPELSHSALGYTWVNHNWCWNSSGSYSASTDDEINAWFHGTLMYEMFKDSPFNHDMMTQSYFTNYVNDKLTINVRSSSTTTGSYAAATGEITLGQGTSQTTNPALDNDWIYHEMAHAVHYSVMDSNYYTYGGGNFSGIKEGLADYWTCTINNDSEVFEVSKPSSARDLDNELVDGVDCTGGENTLYCVSQIFGGSLWDVRQALGTSIGNILIFESMFDDAVFFEDYLDALLVNDDILYGDGDGTVTTSTPHLDKILYAFGDHGYYPATASFPPAAPKNVALTDISAGTRISWDGLNDDTKSDFDYFKVYRKTDPDIGGGRYPIWVSIGTTSNLYFDDTEFDMNPSGTVEAWYKVITKDDSGVYSNYSETVETDGYEMASKKVHDPSNIDNPIPSNYKLVNNFPNPFNPSTTIQYGIPKTSHVNIDIVNIQGKTVKTLVNDTQIAGWHTVDWNGLNTYGESTNTGLYLCVLRTKSQTYTLKLLYLK